MKATAVLAAALSKAILVERQRADEQSIARRKERLEHLTEGTDDYQQELYEIHHAQGRVTGYQAGINALTDLIEAFESDGEDDDR